MKSLTEKEREELADLISQKTGCESFILMAGESKFPCESEKKTGHCDGNGHRQLLVVEGYEKEGYILGSLEQLYNVIKRSGDAGGIPSPYSRNL